MKAATISAKTLLAWVPFLTFAGLCIKLVQILRKRNQFAELVNMVPGPPTKPLFGNRNELWVAKEGKKNDVKFN